MVGRGGTSSAGTKFVGKASIARLSENPRAENCVIRIASSRLAPLLQLPNPSIVNRSDDETNGPGQN
jgi:hypothetical protein